MSIFPVPAATLGIRRSAPPREPGGVAAPVERVISELPRCV